MLDRLERTSGLCDGVRRIQALLVEAMVSAVGGSVVDGLVYWGLWLRV